MRLPEWPRVNITRRKETVQSRGINYSDNYTDGDLAGSENLSARRWPYIATRNARRREESVQHVTALTSWNGLVAVVGTDLYYKGAKVEMPEGVEMTAGAKSFVAVNTKLVIWPDELYLDMSTEPVSVKKLGALLEATGAVVDVTEVELNGKVTMTTTVTFTTDQDLTTMFNPGDGVELAGFANAANNRALVIKTVAAQKITVDSGDFADETRSQAVTMERKIPEMDFICESGNRLWGVSNEKKTVYASALGDPTNFNVYQGISTDSYALPVASAGDFTGCCKLSSSVLFWKEQTLHKILGNYPAEYVMYSYDMEGVRAGCGKSMTVINDALFYVGLHGVFTYAGGTPADISAVFGEHVLTEAVGGTDGEKYYLSCLDDGKETLYVFSPNDGVWLREDSFRAIDITREGEDVYLLRRDGSVWVADSREPDPNIDWSMEYKPYYEDREGKRSVQGRKRLTKLLVRAELADRAWMVVETRTAPDRWEEAGKIKGPDEDTIVLAVQAHRGDSYCIRFRGHGPCTIKNVTREYVRGGDG